MVESLVTKLIKKIKHCIFLSNQRQNNRRSKSHKNATNQHWIPSAHFCWIHILDNESEFSKKGKYKHNQCARAMWWSEVRQLTSLQQTIDLISYLIRTKPKQNKKNNSWIHQTTTDRSIKNIIIKRLTIVFFCKKKFIFPISKKKC